MLTMLPPSPWARSRPHHGLGGQVGALEVAVQEAVQLLLGDVGERLRSEGAGVVDQHVDPAEPLDRRTHQGLAGGRGADAARHRGDPVRLPEQGGGLGEPLGVAAVEHDVGPLLQEAAGDVQADAAGRTGDDDGGRGLRRGGGSGHGGGAGGGYGCGHGGASVDAYVGCW